MLGRTGGIETGQNVSPAAKAYYGEEFGSLTDTTDEGPVKKRKTEGDYDEEI